MKPLSACREKVKGGFEGRNVIFFLDYDGTLTRIVRDPAKARLSPQRQKLLREMVRLPGLKVALVSGRSLKDLKKRVPIPGLIYAGNHGLEFKLGRGSAVYPKILSWKPLLKKLARKLEKALKPFPGVWVEDKGVTLSVHYRRLVAGKIKAAQKVLTAILRSCPDFLKLIVSEGKKVWEIRPPVSWNKGHMVQWLLAQAEERVGSPPLPVYIGDDKTDEDSFRFLRGSGITVKVTQNPRELSAAEYYVRFPGEVFDLLKRVIQARKFHVRSVSP